MLCSDRLHGRGVRRQTRAYLRSGPNMPSRDEIPGRRGREAHRVAPRGRRRTRRRLGRGSPQAGPGSRRDRSLAPPAPVPLHRGSSDPDRSGTPRWRERGRPGPPPGALYPAPAVVTTSAASPFADTTTGRPAAMVVHELRRQRRLVQGSAPQEHQTCIRCREEQWDAVADTTPSNTTLSRPRRRCARLEQCALHPVSDDPDPEFDGIQGLRGLKQRADALRKPDRTRVYQRELAVPTELATCLRRSIHDRTGPGPRHSGRRPTLSCAPGLWRTGA